MRSRQGSGGNGMLEAEMALRARPLSEGESVSHQTKAWLSRSSLMCAAG